MVMLSAYPLAPRCVGAGDQIKMLPRLRGSRDLAGATRGLQYSLHKSFIKLMRVLDETLARRDQRAVL
jgi:hypothetical protein